MSISREHMKERLLHILRDETSRDQCIRMVDLVVRVLGETVNPNRRYDQSRPIRAFVTELIDDGHPICTRAGRYGGYYWGHHDEDVEREAALHQSRAASHMRRAAMLRKVGIADIADLIMSSAKS